MKCESYIRWIDDLVDGTLPHAEQKKLQAHLGECPDCRERIRSLQSLLCRSAALPKSVAPARDLWPMVAKKINAAGRPQEEDSFRLFDKHGRPLMRSGRVAAAILAGALILLAAAWLITRAPGLNAGRKSSANRIETTAPETGAPATGESQSEAAKQESNRLRPGHRAAGAAGQRIETAPAQNSAVCQCEPSGEILEAIEKALKAGDSYPSVRATEVVSERLCNFSQQNSSDFFLLKTSLDVLMFPYVSEATRDRYRRWLAGHPDDPGAIYLYAYSLYGKNTPEMIRLMEQLIAENPDFPWPYLALARIHAYPDMPAASQSTFPYRDSAKVQGYLSAFMRLCPESPEPLPVLISIADRDFLSDTVQRMRTLLAQRQDTRSLILYSNLWYLEGGRQAAGMDISEVRKQMAADLKRLRPLAAGRPAGFLSVLYGGYRQIGDLASMRGLISLDSSYEGRLDSALFDMQEWTSNHPKPPADASAEVISAYWESRLKANGAWIKKAPEAVRLWMDRLQVLAQLSNHSESEFISTGEKILSLERAGTGSFKWNILTVAELYANRGVRLDQLPALIEEGIAAAEKRAQEESTDLQNLTMDSSRFISWQHVDSARRALLEAYLRINRPDLARALLKDMEQRLAEWQMQITRISDLTGTAAKKELAAREAWYADARARLSGRKR
jgi:anti-sigma factor RsiW